MAQQQETGTATGMVGQAYELASSTVRTVSDATTAASENIATVTDFIRRYPLYSLAIGVGLGYALRALLRQPVDYGTSYRGVTAAPGGIGGARALTPP